MRLIKYFTSKHCLTTATSVAGEHESTLATLFYLDKPLDNNLARGYQYSLKIHFHFLFMHVHGYMHDCALSVTIPNCNCIIIIIMIT